MSLKSSKKSVKVPMLYGCTIFIQNDQDSNLKRTVESVQFPLYVSFCLVFPRKTSGFRETLASFEICQEFWTKG